MTNQYRARLILDGTLTTIDFSTSTEENPVEVLWTRYGMDTYIASIEAPNASTSDTETSTEEQEITQE